MNGTGDEGDRFGGIVRLYGVAGWQRIRAARVLVVGLGGVGSWTVEALARSGIGSLTLVDRDEVCVTNVNRQLHALDGLVGRNKAEALAERVAAIHPGCVVEARAEYFTAATAASLLTPGYDAVVDAIDVVRPKCLLIAECRDRGLPVVTCGGAGGRRDPGRVEVADLSRTRDDALLAFVRKRLRSEHQFPLQAKRKWHVDCVFSGESPVYPQPDGSVGCQREPGTDLRLNCDAGYGTATFVTGTFGFALAARVVSGIADESLRSPAPARAVEGEPCVDSRHA